MKELKPCPFCGKRGHVRLTKKTRGSQSGEQLQYFYVACGSPHCPVSMATQTFVVEEHAIKAWNTRTESSVCNICHGSGELCKGARQCDHDGSECDNDHNCGEFEAGGACWKCGGTGDISAKSAELEELKSRYCRVSEEAMKLKEQMDAMKNCDNCKNGPYPLCEVSDDCKYIENGSSDNWEFEE